MSTIREIILENEALRAEVARLRTHENGEQESEAVTFGYIDRLQLERWDVLRGTEYEVAERAYIGFSKMPFTSALSDCTVPIFLAPPSSKAIETAAILRAAETCGQMAEKYYPHRADEGLVAERCEQAILALIPQDGRTALEEFGMKVAKRSWWEVHSEGVVIKKYREDKQIITFEYPEVDNQLRAIVKQVMEGVEK